MSSIAMKPIIPTDPEEKCIICQYNQAETPNQEWVGHSLSEKIIENGKEIEKLKWAHNFHRECLIETAKTGYSLCPGACGNSIDPSSLHSRAERAAILVKNIFNRRRIERFAVSAGRDIFNNPLIEVAVWIQSAVISQLIPDEIVSQLFPEINPIQGRIRVILMILLAFRMEATLVDRLFQMDRLMCCSLGIMIFPVVFGTIADVVVSGSLTKLLIEITMLLFLLLRRTTIMLRIAENDFATSLFIQTNAICLILLLALRISFFD